MKKKFGLWLNIVTICLCMCAIAIGVYAATNASLTVSGTIGFESHGVEMIIDGTLSGYVTSVNSADIQNNTSLTQVKLDKTKNKDAMDMGKVYFTDLVGDSITPITLKLEFTNKSPFKVRANISVPTTTTQNVNVTADKDTLVIDANNGTGDITYTFTIDNANTSIDDLATQTEETLDLSTITGLKVDFVKYTKDSTEHEQGELYVENGRLYVEYGYYPTEDVTSETNENFFILDIQEERISGAKMYGDNLGKPIRWVAFKDLTEGSTLNMTALESVPETGSFYFISEYAFDIYAFNSDQSEDSHPVNGKNPNDYAASEIRTYLTDETSSDGFIKKFKLDNLVKDTRLGEGRLLPSETMSSFIEINDSYHEDYADGYIVDGKAEAISGCQDKLWLLSCDEYEFELERESLTVALAFFPSQASQLALVNELLLEQITQNGAIWWLRSHEGGTYNNVLGVQGDFISNGVGYGPGFIEFMVPLRPAFQLNIA